MDIVWKYFVWPMLGTLCFGSV